MRLLPAVVCTSVLCLVAVACGNTDKSSGEQVSTNGTTSAPEATLAGSETLPDGCTLAPFTIEAQRAGTSPAGAAEFQVTDAIAVPIPIVPDPDSTLDASAKAELATTTDLLGYSVVFGDEALGDNGAVFFDYEPSAEGKTRGQVSIYPATPTPIVAGDVVTYATTTGLSFPLPTIGLDLVTFGDDTNSYLNSPAGQVAVLAITDDAVCLGVDLTWTVSSPKDNVLTIKGLITGRLLDRSTIIALG